MRARIYCFSVIFLTVYSPGRSSPRSLGEAAASPKPGSLQPINLASYGMLMFLIINHILRIIIFFDG